MLSCPTNVKKTPAICVDKMQGNVEGKVYIQSSNVLS